MPRTSTKTPPSVAVVGGGIAGLYCARKLVDSGCTVSLFEMLDRVGGRIESKTDFEGFTAEFGPMRFEPKLQPLFSQLCEDLGVSLAHFPGPEPEDRDTSGFKYPDLAACEKDDDGKPLNALSLLKLGVLKMFDDNPSGKGSAYLRQREEWLKDLDLLPSHPPRPTAREAKLTAQSLRKEATVPGKHIGVWGTPWRDLGFWNALSEVLSHEAILTIRDFGTFYHLIPDNPNAIEWAIFWLRLFQLGDEPLATVTEGVSTIVTKLEKYLTAHDACCLHTGNEVRSLAPARDRHRVTLTIRTQTPGGPRDTRDEEFDQVILALPQRPLQNLAAWLPRSVRQQLDSVIGFPLLKVFAVVQDPWWLGEALPDKATPEVQELMTTGKIPFMSHRRAGKIPTREAHYYKSQEKRLGMVMLYTDHPARPERPTRSCQPNDGSTWSPWPARSMRRAAVRASG